MENKKPKNIKSISEFHKMLGAPPPAHPLISIIDYSSISFHNENAEQSVVFDGYAIAIKRDLTIKMFYGQQQYDFDEGVMLFMGPKQVLRIETDKKINVERSGWIFLIHPDFLWNTSLAKNIKKYEFFDYIINEALFLSPDEETIINQIIKNISHEYRLNIDKFTQDIIISQIETLLNYSERFYQRQFITRKIANHKILERLNDVLTAYIKEDLVTKGLPTVQNIANTLNLSVSYLSGVLKNLTGRSTQQHIQDRIIELAKEKLSITDLSVSEIAYELGFEHSQSFSKFFKSKTNLSPLSFRQSFKNFN